MGKTSEKLKKAIGNMRLTSVEKADMKACVLKYVRENPVVYYENKKTPLPAGELFAIFISRKVFGLLATVVLVVAGVSVAAREALPGNALYPVKIGLNEKMLQTFAFSDFAKARLDASLAEKRLIEAEALSSKGELKTEVREHLTIRFEVFADRAIENISRLEEKDKIEEAIEISGKFEATLNAHGDILAKISGLEKTPESQKESVEVAPVALSLRVGEEEVSASSSEQNLPEEPSLATSMETVETATFMMSADMSASTTVSGLQIEAKEEEKSGIVSKVSETFVKVSERRAALEARFTSENLSKEAAEKKVKAAKEVLRELEEYLNRQEKTLSASAKEKISEIFSLSKEAYEESARLLGEGQYSVSFEEASRSIRLSEEGKIIFQARDRVSKNTVEKGDLLDELPKEKNTAGAGGLSETDFSI
ncbi:MAG: DUF5667 domain-containing protein [bacterium]|nr:DUF5667 domain-containing protein [bacterium]